MKCFQGSSCRLCRADFIGEEVEFPLPGPPHLRGYHWQWHSSLDDHQNNFGSFLKIQVPEPSPTLAESNSQWQGPRAFLSVKSSWMSQIISHVGTHDTGHGSKGTDASVILVMRGAGFNRS